MYYLYLFLGNCMLLNSYAVVAVLKSELEKSYTILKSAKNTIYSRKYTFSQTLFTLKL